MYTQTSNNTKIHEVLYRQITSLIFTLIDLFYTYSFFKYSYLVYHKFTDTDGNCYETTSNASDFQLC